MEDTAEALLGLLLRRDVGVRHLDSNAGAGHRCDDSVRALAERFERFAWRIDVNDHYVHDQRLADLEPLLPRLTLQLPALTAQLQGASQTAAP
jgi:hypothetical protein